MQVWNCGNTDQWTLDLQDCRNFRKINMVILRILRMTGEVRTVIFSIPTPGSQLHAKRKLLSL